MGRAAGRGADAARRALGALLRHAERRGGGARARAGGVLSGRVDAARRRALGLAGAAGLGLAALGCVGGDAAAADARATGTAAARPAELRATRWQDLIIRQAAPPLQHDPATGSYTCDDETAFSLALRAGERRLFHADLDGEATLVVGACSEGASPSSPRALRVHLTFADGREEEYRRDLPRGWSMASLPLAPPRAGRVRLRLATDVPEGQPVFLRDLAVRTERPAAAPRAARRAILISLDAVREDALGATGGTARTPHLDRLAAEAERFRPHWAAEISTKPSHASMLTGLPAAVHGCDRGETPLAEEISTLAERLTAARVSTGAFLSVAPFFHPRYRLDQGFGTYRLVAWSAAQELREAGEWLAEHRDEPFFLFLHLYGAHSDFARLPYEAAGVSRRTVEEIFGVADYGCQGDLCASQRLGAIQRGAAAALEHESEIVRFLYDRGIESLDADVGAFFDELRHSGLWDDTLVVVTADHGEQFGERGHWLHESLHEETLRVPLLVKWPRGARAGGLTERPSASIDLAPTILAHFGLGADDLPGRDLARAAAETPGARAMVSLEAVRVGDRKLILGSGSRPEALFDLASDPAETRNLLPGGEAEAERLLGVWRLAHERARRLAGSPAAAAARPFTAEEIERLRSLGYLR